MARGIRGNRSVYMSYPKNKYRKGYTIFGISDLLHDILLKGKRLYFKTKLVHPSFVLDMPLREASLRLEMGQFSEAINAQREWVVGEYQRPYPDGVAKRKSNYT